MRTPFFRLAALAMLSLPSPARAAAPVLDQLFPIAFAPGSTNRVELVGKNEAWPPSFWTDHPGIVFNPGTNAAACTVALARDVPPGPHWLRLHNADGASAAHFLVVDPTPSTAETEPNDHFAKAQFIAVLPATIDGRLEKSGDVDSYAVDLRAGRTLVARIEAHVLMSPVDTVLRVVDARGVEVAFNHDDGRTLDSFLAWTAPHDGRYVVQAFGFPHPANSDIQFTGNPRCVYRLTLTDGPWFSHTVPLVARRGAANHLDIVGWNLPASLSAGLDFPASAASGSTLTVRVEGAANVLEVSLADEPQSVEHEPNDLAEQAQPLLFPGAVTGTMEGARDVDRYSVELPASPIEFAVQSASFGFPLDVRLRVEDPSGKVVAHAEESTPGDPLLAWTPPKAGAYRVVLDRLVHRDLSRAAYHLAIRAPRPAVELSLSQDFAVLEPGKTNETKIAVARRGGFTNALAFRVDGLPPGVVALPLEIAPTGGEGVLKLVAATNAAPAESPLRVVATGTGFERLVSFPLAGGGENNGVPQGFSHLLAERIEHLWLTVKPAPASTNAVPAK